MQVTFSKACLLKIHPRLPPQDYQMKENKNKAIMAFCSLELGSEPRQWGVRIPNLTARLFVRV